MVRDNKDLTVEEGQKIIDENESVNGIEPEVEEVPEEIEEDDEDNDNSNTEG